jgi:hypothetical protein
VRVYNTGKEPFHYAFNGTNYVWQPKGGGKFAPVSILEEFEFENKLGERRKTKGWKVVLQETLPKTLPDYCEVPDDFARSLFTGSLVKEHGGRLKTQADLEHILAAESAAREAENARLDAELAAKRKQLKELDEERIQKIAKKGL